MKILIINGSPRRNGNISQMLCAMKNEAEKIGAEVEEIRANDLDIKPCIGCMACRSKGECSLPEDDSQRTLRKIQEADALIIGAPCYWGNIPGQLKILFDRIVYGLMRDTARFPEPLLKGKRCVLLSTSTTIWPFNIMFNQSHGAIRAMREICRYSGIKVVKCIEVGGTARKKSISESTIERCRKAVIKL